VTLPLRVTQKAGVAIDPSIREFVPKRRRREPGQFGRPVAAHGAGSVLFDRERHAKLRTPTQQLTDGLLDHGIGVIVVAGGRDGVEILCEPGHTNPYVGIMDKHATQSARFPLRRPDDAHPRVHSTGVRTGDHRVAVLHSVRAADTAEHGDLEFRLAVSS